MQKFDQIIKGNKNRSISSVLLLIILILFFIVSSAITVYAQDENENGDEGDFRFEFNPAIGLGSVTINNESYIDISGIIEMLIWKIGFGIDIDLQIKSNGNIRSENWDSLSDWLSKIVYISYGWKGDKPLYAQYGSIMSYSIGHGTIVSSFRNTNNDPALKRRGLILDLDFNFLGVESFLSDISSAPITGMRMFIRPFELVNLFGLNLDIPILQEMQIGATYVTDTSPDDIVIEDGSQTSYININGVNHALSIYGFDIGIPLINEPNIISSIFYTDYNIIPDLGTGLHAGLYGSIIPESLNIIYKVEFLVVTDGYDSSFFNSRYYNDRGFKYLELSDTRNEGTLTGISLLLGKVFVDTEEQYIRFALGGKEIFGDDLGGELEASLIMLGLIPRFNFNFSYKITNLHHWEDFIKFDYHSTMMVVFGYQVTGAEISFIYSRSFIYDSTNLEYIPVDSLTIETKIIF
jgi:hypothetical protein